MKNRGYKNLKSILAVVMIAITLVSSIFSAQILAQDSEANETYFVVEKTWQNDVESKRPASIKIHVVGSDGSDLASTLTAAEGWKKEFLLDENDEEGNEIVYTVYEEKEGLDAYALGATEENPVTIKNKISIPGNEHTGDKYVVTYGDINNAPKGTVALDSALMMADAQITMDEDVFEYMKSCRVYGNTIEIVNTSPRIAYKGSLKAGANEVGDVSMLWTEKATNSYSGEKYDVRVTLNDIVIYSLVDIDNSENLDRYVAILANQGNLLHMQAYVGPDFDSKNLKKNIVGVEADVIVEVLKDGQPVSKTTQVYLQDLDMPNFARFYEEGYAGMPGDGYYGVENKYVESVDLMEGVLSDVYLADDSNLETKVSDSMLQLAALRGSSFKDSNSLRYLADTAKFSFHWSGSNCGTVIISSGSNPDIKDPTNTITNISSRYLIEYYYQEESESGVYYPSTPYDATDETMVPPGTEIEVDEADKTPAAEKANYVLDESMNADWKGTTSGDAAENPLVLKVYFKKQYIVRYHDNVDNTVFEQQDNPSLDYATPTPSFDTDVEAEGIQAGDPVRQGYTFLGWSEEPDSEIIEVPEKVTKDADYWAHWAPALNKYRVEYYYEVGGKYPSEPDFKSTDRAAYTEDKVSIIDADKVPQKAYYKLNDQMTEEWTGIVLPDGTLVLKVYFKPVPVPVTPSYVPPVTGVE